MEAVKRAFVLMSGGLDSTTCLYAALDDKSNDGGVEAVSIDYAQRHRKEMTYARNTCTDLAVTHTIIELPDTLLAGQMLTDATREIPKVDYADIKGVSPTFVPFRNGLMLSLLAAHAQKWVNADETPAKAELYFGAHAEDAANWAYPDCTPEFIGAMANAIYIGTYQSLRLVTPLMWMKKHEVVTFGHNLGVPFENTWSCYEGGEMHCGECPTCRSRITAFRKAGVMDPTPYKRVPDVLGA